MINKVIEHLEKNGVKTKRDTIIKNGVELDCLILDTGYELRPIVYIKDIEQFSLEEAIEYVDWVLKQKQPKISMSEIMKPEYLKENIYIGLQQKTDLPILKKECELIKDTEYYLYIAIDNYSSTALHEELMEKTTLNEDKLWTYAEQNTAKNTVIKSFIEIIESELDIPYDPEADLKTQFMLTNKTIYKGAGGLACKELIENFAKENDMSKFYIIPSSIHELIFIKDENNPNMKEELHKMVKEINETTVAPTDRLSDYPGYFNYE